MRSVGIVVNNVPKHSSVNRKSSLPLIYILDLDLSLSLEMDGAISHINNWYPNESEKEICIHEVLTRSAVWEPHSKTFAQQEEILLKSGDVKY